MDNFKNLFPINLYHSYIVEGDLELTIFNIRNLLEERGEIKVNSSDLFIRIYDSFTVDDSKQIKEWHSELGVTEDKKICIIGAKFINHDAERTLLKIIEEPAMNTHFFLVVPNSSILLDTIRSRAHLINTKNNNDNFKNKALEFVSLDIRKRIDFVSKFIKEHDKGDGSGGLRFSSISLINEIEKVEFDKFKKDPKNKKIYKLLYEIQKNREYLNLPGSGVKMILEYLALVI